MVVMIGFWFCCRVLQLIRVMLKGLWCLVRCCIIVLVWVLMLSSWNILLCCMCFSVVSSLLLICFRLMLWSWKIFRWLQCRLCSEVVQLCLMVVGEKLCCLVLLMLVWLVRVLVLLEIIRLLCGCVVNVCCRICFSCGLVLKVVQLWLVLNSVILCFRVWCMMCLVLVFGKCWLFQNFEQLRLICEICSLLLFSVWQVIGGGVIGLVIVFRILGLVWCIGSL